MIITIFVSIFTISGLIIQSNSRIFLDSQYLLFIEKFIAEKSYILR